MTLPTASGIERAMQCTASLLLPQGPDSDNPSRIRGNVAHAMIAHELRGRDLGWTAPDVGRHRIKMDLLKLREWLGDGELRCELALEYEPENWVTNVIGENVGRDYPHAPGRLYGTADIVVLRRRAIVLDVKTGRHRVTQAMNNWQLRALAVMIAAAYEVDSVVGALAYLDKSGDWFFDAHEFSRFDIGDFATTLADKTQEWLTAKQLQDEGWQPTTTPSVEACRWCRAVGCDERITVQT